MRDEKKREIRNIALDLFREKGYEKVSVNQIAAAAGISKNTFYYYFAGKEELIIDLFHPDFLFEEDAFVQLSDETDPYKQIYILNESIISYFARLGKPIVRVALMANLTRDFTAVMHHKHKETPRMIRIAMNLYRRAMEEGKIRRDLSIEEILKLTVVILNGCLQIWATAPMEFDLTRFYLQHIEQVLSTQK